MSRTETIKVIRKVVARFTGETGVSRWPLTKLRRRAGEVVVARRNKLSLNEIAVLHKFIDEDIHKEKE